MRVMDSGTEPGLAWANKNAARLAAINRYLCTPVEKEYVTVLRRTITVGSGNLRTLFGSRLICI